MLTQNVGERKQRNKYARKMLGHSKKFALDKITVLGHASVHRGINRGVNNINRGINNSCLKKC